MKGRPKKNTRQKDLTAKYLAGDVDEDRVDQHQRFSQRSKHHQQNKMQRTATMRAEDHTANDIAALPIGQVVTVYSLYIEVEHEQTLYLCVMRKTLTKVAGTQVVVGDRVRFRPGGTFHESGRPEAAIEQILPRTTVLTRSESFKGLEQHPIVANAQQMLIVVSVLSPRVKWGLVDRMLVAAQSGGLDPIVCLNKIDLAAQASSGEEPASEPSDPEEALSHYRTMGIRTLKTSILGNIGLEDLRQALTGHVTVLAGHSGVGKSSLIRAIQPSLEIRVGDVSLYTDKGRHTTTSARRYHLDGGGAVIDTPGVKLFGLWGITRENLVDYFPDVESDSAPRWRRDSYQRIVATLPEPQ
jgi:ribosome biogenesis GTPase / thiamine phosphate phosphatase